MLKSEDQNLLEVMTLEWSNVCVRKGSNAQAERRSSMCKSEIDGEDG